MDREVEAFVFLFFFLVLILSFSRVDFLRQWDYWMYVGLVIRSITTNKVAYLSVLISSMQPIPILKFTCQYPRWCRRCRSLTEEMTSQIGKSGLVNTQSPPREPNYGIFTVSWFENYVVDYLVFKFPTKQQLHDYLGENTKLTMSAVCIIHN